MKKITVNFWAWSNICTDPQKGIINGYNRSCAYYGHSYECSKRTLIDDSNPWNNLYFFIGENIAETEKAICFSVPCYSFDRYSNITKNYKWKIWIPKKCIIDGVFEYVEWGKH